MKENEDLTFVARHYRRGMFDAGSGWRRLGIVYPTRWRRFRVAAAVAGVIVVSATATVLYRQYRVESTMDAVTDTPVVPVAAVRVIDFENTPLPDVVARIKEVYGVEIGGVPADASAYHLSLHYEGNVVDLVEAINDILSIELTVEE